MNQRGITVFLHLILRYFSANVVIQREIRAGGPKVRENVCSRTDRETERDRETEGGLYLCLGSCSKDIPSVKQTSSGRQGGREGTP